MMKMRREAFKLVNAQTHTLHQALQHVIKCPELKETHFTTPLAVMSASRSRGFGEGRPSKYLKKGDGKGDPKGGGKGNRKGKSKDKQDTFANKDQNIPGDLKLADRVPDGRQLCWNFNNGTYCDAQCGRVHQCRVLGCYGNHAARHHKKHAKRAGGGAPTPAPE